MTATTFTRSRVAQRLFDLIADAEDLPDDVEVLRSVRAATDRRAQIFQGDILGDTTSVPTMRAGRNTYRDQFRVEVFCVAWTAGDDTFADSDTAVEQLAEIVRSVVADNPQLTGDDTLCVTSAVVTLADGPNGYHTDHGSASAMRLEVSIDQRINPQ